MKNALNSIGEKLADERFTCNYRNIIIITFVIFLITPLNIPLSSKFR